MIVLLNPYKMTGVVLPAPTVSSIVPATGSPTADTNVTITGTGFAGGGATEANVGGGLANFVVVNNTTITATVGVHDPTSVFDVVVTGPGGTGTLTNGFSVPLAGIDSTENMSGGHAVNSGSHLGGENLLVHGWGFVDQSFVELWITSIGGAAFFNGGASVDDDLTLSGVTNAHAAGAVNLVLETNAPPFTFTGWTYT